MIECKATNGFLGKEHTVSITVYNRNHQYENFLKELDNNIEKKNRVCRFRLVIGPATNTEKWGEWAFRQISNIISKSNIFSK